MSNPLVIGISARIHHPAPPAPGYGPVYHKTLHYFEESVAHWVLARNVLAVMIPGIESEGLVRRSALSVSAYADLLDGLVLQGGADLAPESYGESPLAPEWSGDRIRDRYEIDLFNAFVTARKPVVGICRGCQLINVALGGTLFQDIPTQVTYAISHRDDVLYDDALHEIDIVRGTKLADMYPGIRRAKVNSLHHQAVKELGKDLVVEAVGVPDGVIEAIRWQGPSYVFGVQWHPEFLAQRSIDKEQIDGLPILSDFLAHALERRQEAA